MAKNLKSPKDFIEMLYFDEGINEYVDMMRSVGMWNFIFADKYDADMHEVINDLYARLRVFGFPPEGVEFIFAYHGEKILKWLFDYADAYVLEKEKKHDTNNA